MKHRKTHTQNPYRTAPYTPIGNDYTKYRTGKKPAHRILDTAYRRHENIWYSAETEENLFLLFSELDGLILDNMPDALCIEPVNLIRLEYQRQTGVLLNTQNIIDAYLRFVNAEHGGNP